jgi:hypothetical protein
MVKTKNKKMMMMEIRRIQRQEEREGEAEK